MGDHLTMIVDSTPFPIQRPKDPFIQSKFYNGKFKKHIIKYEMAISWNDYKIVWKSNAYLGSVHDITISRNSELLDSMLRGEVVFADKGYVGNSRFWTPFKGILQNSSQYEWSVWVSKRRIVVEHLFSKNKMVCLYEPKMKE